MEAVKYLFFSLLEGIAGLAFMLTLFRFNPRYYLMPILVLSAVTSVSSYFFRMHWDMTYLDPIVQFAVVIVGIMWMLEINLLLAIMITFLGYIGYGFIQTLLLMLVKVIGMLTIDNLINSYNLQGILLSVSTDLITVLLSWFLFRKGWGFVFSFKKTKNVREVIFFGSIILLAIAVIGTISYCLYHQIDSFSIFLLLFFTLLAFLLYFALQKEKRND